MKPSEIKIMLISSLNAGTDTTEISGRLEEEGISFDFKSGFRDKIVDKIFSAILHLTGLHLQVSLQ
jgi:hypothetical protein